MYEMFHDIRQKKCNVHLIPRLKNDLLYPPGKTRLLF